MKLYGITTCDTVRKARKALKEHSIDYTFVDMRKTPVACKTIDRWLAHVPIEVLFNKRGTTYRKLGLKEMNLDAAGMREWLCKENPLIKRPIVEMEDGEVIVGYDAERYSTLNERIRLTAEASS